MKTFVPIGVVSKNDVGDRSTPLKAALNRFKLANKLNRLGRLFSRDCKGESGTHAKLKLSKNIKKADATPKPAYTAI